jgi:hypothetical protein
MHSIQVSRLRGRCPGGSSRVRARTHGRSLGVRQCPLLFSMPLEGAVTMPYQLPSGMSWDGNSWW